MIEHDGELHSHDQARTHDWTLSQPQITKSLSEEIIHAASSANRSEGRNNESPDAPEPAGDLAHRGPDEWTAELRIFGPGRFSRASNVSWRGVVVRVLLE